MFCSGENGFEQTGQPYENGQNTPWQPLEGLTGVTDLSVGQYNACAVDGSNQILCWGNEDSGRLGRGEDLPGNRQWEPVQVTGTGAPYDRVWTNSEGSCGRRVEDGGFRCWGHSRYGLLNGISQPRLTHTPAPWMAAGSHLCVGKCLRGT